MYFDWLRSMRFECRHRRSVCPIVSELRLEERVLLSPLSIGPETQVNSFTTGAQRDAVIGMDADGDFVVAWHSSGQDGSGYGIYAQRYNSAGVPQGGEIQVNSHTTGGQYNPVIGMDADGDFVVAWMSYQDGGFYGIYAQRYNSAGVPQGGEFQVNSYTTEPQRDAAIAMDEAGDFIITWQSFGQDGNDYGIYAQRYDSSGVAQGGEFRVNTATTSLQRHPAVAMDEDGDFIVAWNSYGQDGSYGGIYAQRYNAAGVPQGGEFQVNNVTTSYQFEPAVGMDSAGNFLISWVNNGVGSGYDINARRYNSAGTALGTEFPVNSYTTGHQSGPAVGVDADGDFLITWHSAGQDGSGLGIYAQRYLAAGGAEGGEFRVNSHVANDQSSPAIGMDEDGDFVIGWQSSGQDLGGYGLFIQRYRVSHEHGLGIWRNGSFYLDSNQNDVWNGSVVDSLDYFGNSSDKPLAGDWNGDGYSDIGIWRNGTFYLDANGNGEWDGPATDRQFSFGNATDTPIVGDWNGDGKDEIGIWRAGRFYLDLNANRNWDLGVDTTFPFGNFTDTPLTGDWNGDGIDDIGVWRAGVFYLDQNGNQVWNIGLDLSFVFGNPSDSPIVGDWNGDGADEIGIWRSASFYQDSNGNHVWNVGVDEVITFGNSTDTPLLGYWRPNSVPGNPPPAPLSLEPIGANTSKLSLIGTKHRPMHDAPLASLLAPTRLNRRFAR